MTCLPCSVDAFHQCSAVCTLLVSQHLLHLDSAAKCFTKMVLAQVVCLVIKAAADCVMLASAGGIQNKCKLGLSLEQPGLSPILHGSTRRAEHQSAAQTWTGLCDVLFLHHSAGKCHCTVQGFQSGTHKLSTLPLGAC